MRDEDRVKLWDAINAYAITCGGDPSRFVYGNTPRQKAVAEIETLVRAVAQAAREEEREACLAGVDSVLHQWEMGDPCRNAVLQCMAEISARSRSAAGWQGGVE
jgi:hypothetical protein